MCGICGIIDYSGKRVDEGSIRSMCSQMQHRGPDDEGVYINNKSSAGLGHRRLSIIDLSTAGHQPMSNEDKTIWLVLNGEVYNYRELKIFLEARGHKFISDTDTETVVHLYEEYGEYCLKHIRGMFAFAVWDEKKQILFAARDRSGKKPFLYSNHNGWFCFASEFAALLASGFVSKEIDHSTIHSYLTFGYIPAPSTIYRSVFKLPAAHSLLLKDGKLEISKYWELDYSKKIAISEQDACKETLRLLEEATRIRLYSDVPLGAFLSGGIDSSAIVGLMSKVSPQRVKTFSIGFAEKDYDELKYARNIAKRFNTDHHEFIVRPNALEVLPLLVERYGEPYADSSCIPTYYVAKETKQYVTVALNGDGGDESFAGYERYQAMLLADSYQKKPEVFKKIVAALVHILPDSVNSKNKLRRIKRFLGAVNLPNAERYLRWVSIFDGDLIKGIYSRDFKNRLALEAPLNLVRRYIDSPGPANLLDRLLKADVNTYLPDDLLVKVDIAAMANSLEGRSPFLDHKLMEFCASLPVEYKLRGNIKKYILKKAIKDMVPAENLNRGKMGFGVPVGNWFRKELKPFLKENLLSEKSLGRGYFNPDTVKSMVEAHSQARKDYSFQLWALLMLELWHKRYID